MGYFQLDVSDRGHVWGVNRNRDIYRWTGRGWQHIGGKAVQATVGPSGVWVVNRGHNIYYRRGTYGDPNSAGSGVSIVKEKDQHDIVQMNNLHNDTINEHSPLLWNWKNSKILVT